MFRPPALREITMTTTEEKPQEEEFKGGAVLQCGATDWWAIGRSKEVRSDLYPNLASPHRLKALEVGGAGGGGGAGGAGPLTCCRRCWLLSTQTIPNPRD